VDKPLRHETDGPRKLAQGHACTNDLGLLDHERLERHGRGLFTQPCSHDPACRTNHLDGLRKRGVLPRDRTIVSNTLDDAIRAHAAGQIEDVFDRILLGNVDDMVRTECTGGLQAQGLQVGDDGRGGPSAVAEDVEDREPELARAQDHDGLTGLHLSSLQDMMAQRVHLHHGREGHGDVVRQGVDVAVGRGHVLPESAGQVHP